MTRTISTHIRSNVIGYLALFVALSGSAYAVATVGPDDIRRDAVRSKHIAKNAVKAPDVKDETLSSRDVKNAGLSFEDVQGLDVLATQAAALDKQLNGPNGLAAQMAALASAPGGLEALLPLLNSIAPQITALCDNLDALAGWLNTWSQEFNDLVAALQGVPGIPDLSGISLPPLALPGC